MENIVWKDIPIEEFKNSYQISNDGQIRNKKTLKVKATQYGSTGYITTRLDIGSCKKTVQIHSMVAEAFLKPIEDKKNKKIIVKFRDENKNNVNLSNLYFDYQNDNKPKIAKVKIVDDDDDDDDEILENKINNLNKIVAKINIVNDNQNLNEEITINDFKGKTINDYPNYLISKDGQVYSLRSKKIRIPEINETGYCKIKLMNGTSKTGRNFYMHQLVAKAYIPNPNNYDQVNHKDLNKHNNVIDNLEWCDGSMNMQHNADNKPENCRKVIQYDPLDKNKVIAIYGSIKEASLQTKINNTSIIHCCSGKYKTGGGFIWKYDN